MHWNDIVLPEADITIGKWFHVTLTFKDAIEGKLYIDGSLKGTNNMSFLKSETYFLHGVNDIYER